MLSWTGVAAYNQIKFYEGSQNWGFKTTSTSSMYGSSILLLHFPSNMQGILFTMHVWVYSCTCAYRGTSITSLYGIIWAWAKQVAKIIFRCIVVCFWDVILGKRRESRSLLMKRIAKESNCQTGTATSCPTFVYRIPEPVQVLVSVLLMLQAMVVNLSFFET